MKRKQGRILPVFAVMLFLFSCQTVQEDLHLSSMDETARTELAALEEAIVSLETAPRGSALGDTRKKIGTLAGIPDNEFQARLAAWSGRLFLLEGNVDEARRELRKSQTLSPDNWVQVILAARLERDVQKRLALLDDAISLVDSMAEIITVPDHIPEGSGELHIERGRVLLELGRFSETVASFDLAFSLLETKPYYRANYQASRDRAWDLRNLAEGTGGAVVERAEQDGISWRDVIEITKTETDFLRFLTAGRDWSPDEIFERLLERSFIPLTQNIYLSEWPAEKPKADELVLRSGAAWFLWRLNAENRANRGLLSRYSSRYANRQGAQSPVADLPLLSPFFDSVLGCIESEFMSMPDGMNFVPDEKVRASTFLAMLKKL